MRKTWLNTYFDLNKREFNGLMILSVLMLLLLVFPYVYDRLFPYEYDVKAARLAIRQLEVVDQSEVSHSLEKDEGRFDKRLKKQALSIFDPNTIDLKGWQELGLSLKQAQSILKYRSKGGKFYKAQDLQKMYTISPEMYVRLMPYVRIESMETKNRFSEGSASLYKKDHIVPRILPVIELNGADTLQLDQVKGIGPAFARRIVNYRMRLGGFCNKEQLLEVFGLDSALYNEIKAQLRVDLDLVKKININTAVTEDFKNHPYIRYKQVNALIQYRKQHGNYGNIEDLKKVAVLTPELVAKLAPYLSF